jgi:hypothetical protein
MLPGDRIAWNIIHPDLKTLRETSPANAFAGIGR